MLPYIGQRDRYSYIAVAFRLQPFVISYVITNNYYVNNILFLTHLYGVRLTPMARPWDSAPHGTNLQPEKEKILLQCTVV